MRTACLNCARKHLAQASILMMEAKQGYPLHEWFAMGHLAEAGDELVQEWSDVANEIREHRKLSASFSRNGCVSFSVGTSVSTRSTRCLRSACSIVRSGN